MISPIFQKPVVQQRAQSPFQNPDPVAPQDGFQASQPILLFQPALPMEAPKAQPRMQSATQSAVAAALAALPAPMAAAYQSVLSVLSDSPNGPAQLAHLLEKGKLTDSTLENLQSLTQQPRAAGLDGAALTRETVAILSAPDQTIWQGDRFTCGASNLERQLAENPETFTSLVANLSNHQGKAQLPSGFILERPDGALSNDGSGRNSTDRVVQSAIMATAGSARGEYHVSRDRFGEDQEPGLKIGEIAAMTALAQNEPQVVIKYDSKSAKAAQSLISQLKPGESFQTAMTNWEGKEHMLLFQGANEGVASYFDPAAPAQHMIPLHKFLWKTEYLVLPQTIAERVSFPAESIHSQVEPG